MSIHFFFNSIFSKAPLFGVHLHIDAPVGFATSHASTCHVYSPSTTPSPDTTAIIVYNNAYTILHRDDYSFCPFTDISYSVSRCPTSYSTLVTLTADYINTAVFCTQVPKYPNTSYTYY
jgi:hypothetical protein